MPHGLGKSPISDLQKAALHGVALFTQTRDLHDHINQLKSESEADQLLAEHEAKLKRNGRS